MSKIQFLILFLLFGCVFNFSLAQTQDDADYKLPNKAAIAKFMKNYESSYIFKTQLVTATYGYKGKEYSFSYNLSSKDNGQRTLILLQTPKSIKGKAILHTGSSYVLKNPGKKPVEISEKDLPKPAWQSSMLNLDLALNFSYMDITVDKIQSVNKTQFSADLTASNKNLTGFEKAVVLFEQKTNEMQELQQYWKKTDKKPYRTFKFTYQNIEKKRYLKTLEISRPKTKTTVEISNLKFPEKLSDQELDLPDAPGYLSASEIIEKAEDIEKAKAVKSKGKQIIYTSSGTKRELVFQSWAVNNGEKQLMKYITPADVAGDKILMLNDGDDIFVYFHRTGRVRHLATSMRNSSVQNSDFSYQDMGGSYKENYTFSLLRKEKYNKINCYVLNAKPTSKGPSYDKVEFWIDIEKFWIYRADYYDDDKPKPIKRLKIEGWKLVDNHNVATKITMKNLETGSYTIMEVLNTEYPDSLPDSLFSEKELKR